MQEFGISENVFPSNHQASLATGELSEVEEPIDHTSSGSPCEEIHSVSNLQTESTVTDEPDFSPISAKRQKIYAPEGRSPMKLEATEESLLSWLKKFDDGVSCELPFHNILVKQATKIDTNASNVHRLLFLIFWSTSMVPPRISWLIF